MSQTENKMDDFAPFGGTARTEYQEDELAIPHVVSTAVINALDDIMFPMDEQRERPLDCQTYFAVQRTLPPEQHPKYGGLRLGRLRAFPSRWVRGRYRGD